MAFSEEDNKVDSLMIDKMTEKKAESSENKEEEEALEVKIEEVMMIDHIEVEVAVIEDSMIIMTVDINKEKKRKSLDNIEEDKEEDSKIVNFIISF